MEDFELLQSYARQDAEEAFRTLTERYVSLVYASAVRQTGDAELAKDVTQAVFLTLAAKAGGITQGTVLAGWLLRTTRYAAANARRLEQRRQHYEQQAMSSVISTPHEADWLRIAPMLDAALDSLTDLDRDAVVLRFFEQMPLKRVGQKLGISEDGAQKRVTRALEKLRAFFARRGRTVTLTALVSGLGLCGVQAAPTTLSASILAAVANASAPAGSVVATVAQATMSALARARRRLLALRVGSAAVLMGTAVLTVLRLFNSADTPAPAPMGSAAVSPASTPTPRGTGIRSVFVPVAMAPRNSDGGLQLRVVAAPTKTPVEDVRVTLVSSVGAAQSVTNRFVTDADGATLVTYSTAAVKSWSHRLELFRDGYVPKYVSWSEAQQDRIDEIPREYVVALEPAAQIGGVVVDVRGEAVADARVVFSVSGPVSMRARERTTMMGDYHTEITANDGRWSCSHVPERFGMIDFTPNHPLFQKQRWVTDAPEAGSASNIERIPQAEFLALRAIMRLKPGLIVAGIVADSSGQPVSGAKVTQNYDFEEDDANQTTDPTGNFRFQNGRPDRVALTIQAPDFAPVVTSLVFKVSVDNLRIVLPEGRVLRGRVLDEADRPVAGAIIEAASPSSDSRKLFQWRSKTDRDGRFGWDVAPATQEYAVRANGFMTRRLNLDADGAEQTVRLTNSGPAALRIHGEIVDAVTQRAPFGARVQLWQFQREPSGAPFSFTTLPEETSSDGRFRLKTSPGTFRFVVEAQAEGLRPERKTNEVAEEREVHLRFELQRAPVVGGQVLTPDGMPAAKAMLVVCAHDEWAQMLQPGELVMDYRSAGTVSDEQGRFRLPSKHAAELVVVAHAKGFAELPFTRLSSNTVITLSAWARVEGVSVAGARASEPQTLCLTGIPGGGASSPRIGAYLHVTTDSSGRFVFTNLPAGEWLVQRELNYSTGNSRLRMPAFSHGMPVRALVGETTVIQLGGTGRTVVGRAYSSEVFGKEVWEENCIALLLKTESRTPNHARREYRALFREDGTFSIDDVPPGDYTLKVDLFAPPDVAEGNPPSFKSLASLQAECVVPQADASAEASPLDLGELKLKPVGEGGGR